LRVLPRVLTLAFLCLLVLSPLPAHADDAPGDPGPLKVMVAGDSISAGRNGDFTWRYRFDKEFIRQGVPVDLVGSLTKPYLYPGYASSNYADPNFDSDHFARAGWQLKDMVSPTGAEVTKQQPDIIVLEAGVNDILHGRTAQQTATALRAWIDQVRNAKADTRILISPVLSVDQPDSAQLNPEIADYDNMASDIAAELSTDESPITMARTNVGWSPTQTNSWDGIHPTPTGETFIAQRILEAFHDLGVLPQTPQVHRYVPWGYKLPITASLAGRTATLRWSAQAITGARIHIKIVGGRSSNTVFYTSGQAKLTLMPRTTYQFQLQARRKTMTGPWGPVRTLRVAVAAKPLRPAHAKINAAGVHWTAGAHATTYLVQYKLAHQTHWKSRRTAGLSVKLAHVKQARVRAANGAGHSAWRRATH
jgi:hypothetical protein